MIVTFRADAALQIGAGHVMRCLTLADELKSIGVDCHFITRCQPGSLEKLIVTRGHHLHLLPHLDCKNSASDVSTPQMKCAAGLAHEHWLLGGWKNDAEECRSILHAIDTDWLVVDHYGIDERWESALTDVTHHMMVIDDLADRRHQCDVLLDQNLNRQAADYDGLVPHGCRRLIGPEYALLRQEFRGYREQSLKRREHAGLHHILVNLGGVDQDNVTGRVLTALGKAELPPDIHLTIVMGQSAPWVKEVTSQAASLQWRAEVLVGVSNMAEIMAMSDLAIGAAGSTSWERCCLGVPCILTILAENQRLIAQSLENGGAAKAMEIDRLEDELGPLILTLADNPDQLSFMATHAAAMVDGRGATRVVDALVRG